MKGLKRLIGGALALALSASVAQAATEVRIMWYSDGNEGEVLQDLVKRFEAQNPDIKVVVDNVAFGIIKDQLPVQLEAGRGPDIVRVVELKSQAKHWLDLRPHLKDAATFEKNFSNTLDWMREDGSNALPGFMTQLTITGPLVNTTLFEQAGVPVPGDKATWDEWAAAAKKVADSQKIPIALAFDRSGHRFMGPAISMGAKVIGPDGKPAVVDEGFKAMAQRIADWHKNGIMPREIWGGVAGTTYKGANEEFVNGQVAVYFSGSWQVAQFSQKIKDNFDWSAGAEPCGPAACTGMPGGAGLVAVKYTKNPKEVARVVEYLASEPVVREFSERTLFLPAHQGVAAKGVDFKSSDPNVKKSLDTFLRATQTADPLALKMQSYRWSGTIYAAVISRLGQVVAGEAQIPDAYARIEDDIKQKVAEASR
ncbi:ABC transporter substrate-binding protein [Microvirga vignae]|uniref:sn-glycerol-3-phosphate-binding periplasmic protein UgpB n=1 Tax=Microvirga vignae TaxID=1225564 RepID=A0A0H1RB08_9HYPH|nr:ABC transporter substrate-binding protein [Microvirga vignae]KLK92358.1 ABC transporter substrate-binding protein [Microvirga vignae]